MYIFQKFLTSSQVGLQLFGEEKYRPFKSASHLQRFIIIIIIIYIP
jgi:hypothetical protein